MRFSLFCLVLTGAICSILSEGVYSEPKHQSLFLVTAKIVKIEGDTIYLSRGKDAGLKKDMTLTIHSFVKIHYEKERVLPKEKTGLAKIVSVDDKSCVAHITWRYEGTYEDYENDRRVTKKISVSPGDIVAGTYYDQLSPEDKSKAKIILGIDVFPSKRNHRAFKPMAVVSLIGDKTVIETENKELENELENRFGEPSMTRNRDGMFTLKLPNTKEFFEIMRYPALSGLHYDVEKVSK